MKRLLIPLLVVLLIPSSADAFISSSAPKQLLKGGTRGTIKNTSVDKNESKNNSSSTNLSWWGLTEEQKKICRSRASRENTDFSAKQAYNYCKKNIKAEFKEKEEKRLEELKSWKGNCDEEESDYLNKSNYSSDVYGRKYEHDPFAAARNSLKLDQCKKKLKEYNKIFAEKYIKICKNVKASFSGKKEIFKERLREGSPEEFEKILGEMPEVKALADCKKRLGKEEYEKIFDFSNYGLFD